MYIGGTVAIVGSWGFSTLHGDGGLYAVAIVVTLGTIIVGGIIVLIGWLIARAP